MSASETRSTPDESSAKKAWQHELFDHLAAVNFRSSDGLMSVPDYRKKIHRLAVHDKSQRLNVDLREEPRVVHSGHQRHDSLIVGDLSQAVKLPGGTDLNEWLALNILDFYNQVSLLYGALAAVCSSQQCLDDSTGLRYVVCSPKDHGSTDIMSDVCPGVYVKNSLDWMHSLFENESVFPTQDGAGFPPTFHMTITSMCSRLLKIYAHFFNAHNKTISDLGIDNHAYTMFKHLYYFINEFNLTVPGELTALRGVIDRIQKDYIASNQAQ